MPSILSNFQIHLWLLVLNLFLTALLMALYTQFWRRFKSTLAYQLAMFLMVLGSSASGFFTFKCVTLLGHSYEEAMTFGLLVGVLSVAGGFVILEAFDTDNPPIKLLRE